MGGMLQQGPDDFAVPGFLYEHDHAGVVRSQFPLEWNPEFLAEFPARIEHSHLRKVFNDGNMA